MASYGYSYVSDTAFVAFQNDLAEGAWKSVSLANLPTPEMQLTVAALTAPRSVLWKLRLTWAIEGLVQAIGSGSIEHLDAEWDAAQRRIYHRIALRLDSADIEERAAAERLSALLLQGGGTAQTKLDYNAEVDFGRQQVRLVKEGQAAADVELLELADAIHDVEQTTEALAKGYGRKAGSKRAAAPSARQREALAVCTAAFNAVHDDIDWFMANMPSGPDRDDLAALQAPLAALLARNPTPATAAAPTPPAAQQPALAPSAAPTAAPAKPA